MNVLQAIAAMNLNDYAGLALVGMVSGASVWAGIVLVSHFISGITLAFTGLLNLGYDLGAKARRYYIEEKARLAEKAQQRAEDIANHKREAQLILAKQQLEDEEKALKAEAETETPAQKKARIEAELAALRKKKDDLSKGNGKPADIEPDPATVVSQVAADERDNRPGVN